jgi:hypothetical protein
MRRMAQAIERAAQARCIERRLQGEQVETVWMQGE